MLPEDASILFMNANGILDDERCSSMGNECTGLRCESASVEPNQTLTYQIVDLS